MEHRSTAYLEGHHRRSAEHAKRERDNSGPRVTFADESKSLKKASIESLRDELVERLTTLALVCDAEAGDHVFKLARKIPMVVDAALAWTVPRTQQCVPPMPSTHHLLTIEMPCGSLEPPSYVCPTSRVDYPVHEWR